jgi:hypothetical protein
VCSSDLTPKISAPPAPEIGFTSIRLFLMIER